ncbi:phage holin family protein [Streptomyces aureocirculatus]|uniref:phage holin family protein n=1 Tax=Streptomyces aureocirculatus TaxID=67275 RepID=UPI000691925E|nr:phage holin family protein [Streptomyces aureocirculatus]
MPVQDQNVPLQDRTLGDVLSQVVRDAVHESLRQTLRDELRDELRAELSHAAAKQRRKAALYATSGALTLYAGAAAALTVGLALALGLPNWAAALIVTVLLAGAAVLTRNAARPSPKGSRATAPPVPAGDPAATHGTPAAPPVPAAPMPAATAATAAAPAMPATPAAPVTPAAPAAPATPPAAAPTGGIAGFPSVPSDGAPQQPDSSGTRTR